MLLNRNKAHSRRYSRVRGEIDVSNRSEADRQVRLRRREAAGERRLVLKVAAALTRGPIEADRVTGEDCFLAKLVVCDLHELETVIDRFLPFSSADTAIIQSSMVARRLPNFSGA